MNKFLVVLLTIISLTGCQAIMDVHYDNGYKDNIKNISPIYIYYVDLKTKEDVARFLNLNVTYKSDGDEEYWQSPKETLERGTGDCEDFAILFMNLAYYNLGEKWDLVLVDSNSYRKIESGGFINHAIVRRNGVLFDPQLEREVECDVGFSYSFDKVFF